MDQKERPLTKNRLLFENDHVVPSGVDTGIVGNIISPLISLLNHKCLQNVDSLTVDNKTVCFVCYPIKKGEQLFASYG